METNYIKGVGMRIYAFFLIAMLLIGRTWAQELGRSAMDDIELNPQLEPDINRKSREVRQLIRNAARHFSRSSIEVACHDFVHSPRWRKGELFVFVFDQKGVCLAHGDDTYLIWKNISGQKGTGGVPLIKEMLSLRKPAGSISFLWNNAYKSSYIQKVVKNGVTYIIGSGFYPESDEFVTKRIVKTAVAYFNQNGKEAAFALISNPKGPFVRGDVYMFAYDFNGVAVAHGQNAALIGQNLIDQVDSHGKHLIKELIEVARTKGKGWVDYYWRNEFKRSYVERVVDPKTKTPYLLAAGYYPNVTLRVVQRYVKKAIVYLKAQGTQQAFDEFSNQVGQFARGGLGIMVFDFAGNCLANGENPGFVGQNLSKVVDEAGKFYVLDMIKTARRYGRGLVSLQDYNARAIAYVEKVELPEGNFVVAAMYYPDSKIQATQAIVNRAVEALKEKTAAEAFRAFSTQGSEFYQGDLHIFAYDSKGTRLVNGIQTEHTWRNFIRNADQEGRSVISNVIAKAAKGGGWIEYRIHNTMRRVYVKPVEKALENGEIRSLAVGSGYFL